MKREKKNYVEAYINSSDTVDSLKKQLQDKLQIPCEKQKMFFDGEILENEKTFDEYTLIDGSTLHLLVQQVPKPKKNTTIHSVVDEEECEEDTKDFAIMRQVRKKSTSISKLSQMDFYTSDKEKEIILRDYLLSKGKKINQLNIIHYKKEALAKAKGLVIISLAPNSNSQNAVCKLEDSFNLVLIPDIGGVTTNVFQKKNTSLPALIYLLEGETEDDDEAAQLTKHSFIFVP